MANVDLNKDACEEYVYPALRYLEKHQRTPLRVNDWRGGGYFIDDQQWGPLACTFDDTIALDECKKMYGPAYANQDPKPYFNVNFMADVFNADHLVIDDQLNIGNLPHDAKVICRCGYIIMGEWKRYRKKFWPNLPTKIS